MRETLLQKMTCFCGAPELRLRTDVVSANEVREGAVECAACGNGWPVSEGVVLVLNDPPFDKKDAAESEASVEAAGALSDEWLLSLPLPKSEWETSFEPKAGRKAANFFDMFARVAPRGAERVLELAAGTCWVASRFAQRGCEVVACDVDMRKYYGLRSADVYIKATGRYFERVRCAFGRLPFRDEAFDIAFIQSGLQYAGELDLTLSEIARVLVPGGRLALVYTGVRGWIRPNRKAPGHSFRAYARAWRRAGFEGRLFSPSFFSNRLGDASKPRAPLFLRLPLLKQAAKRWGARPGSMLFGVPMNAILTKVRRR